jgi:hypothetical protein
MTPMLPLPDISITIIDYNYYARDSLELFFSIYEPRVLVVIEWP